MRSSLLDCAFSVLAFYKTAAGLRVNQIPCKPLKDLSKIINLPLYIFSAHSIS